MTNKEMEVGSDYANASLHAVIDKLVFFWSEIYPILYNVAF